MQRLDRILSEAGVASRKELRAMIRAGRVTVDGAAVTDESRKFDETAVRVTVDGSPVRLRGPVLILLHKPAGYLTAADDPKAKTVMDLVPEAYRKLGVMPVGRLDKDTEGLLLLTNDGDLAHRILSPRHGVWKRYYAEHEGTAGPADVRAFEAGLVLADGLHCLPAKLTPLGPGRSVGGEVPPGAADARQPRPAGHVPAPRGRGPADPRRSAARADKRTEYCGSGAASFEYLVILTEEKTCII